MSILACGEMIPFVLGIDVDSIDDVSIGFTVGAVYATSDDSLGEILDTSLIVLLSLSLDDILDTSLIVSLSLSLK